MHLNIKFCESFEYDRASKFSSFTAEGNLVASLRHFRTDPSIFSKVFGEYSFAKNKIAAINHTGMLSVSQIELTYMVLQLPRC